MAIFRRYDITGKLPVDLSKYRLIQYCDKILAFGCINELGWTVQ